MNYHLVRHNCRGFKKNGMHSLVAFGKRGPLSEDQGFDINVENDG